MAAEQGETQFPAVAEYCPKSIKDLKPGENKFWCVCGLSKKQPWCDGSHKGSGFKSLKWTVPEKPQSVHYICCCKHTSTPPYCDGTHANLPAIVNERQKNCPRKAEHRDKPATEEEEKAESRGCRLCTSCGHTPDF